jgi:hypothetical protein
MATTTLTEVNATLVEIRDEQHETTTAVRSLTDKISAQMEAAEINRLKDLNSKGRGSVIKGKGPAARVKAKPVAADDSGSSSGTMIGAGLGLGMLGKGMMKSAAGLTAMGLAIPAFFGGLLAGSEGLSWLQDVAGMDYDGLKKAALGFSDIILEMDPKAFVVLGGIMGISAIAKPGAAKSLASMGLAISGFLGGLMAGSTLLEGAYKVADIFGGTIDFGGMKKAMTGFSDMVVSLDPKALTVMGSLLGLGAITGLANKDPLAAAKGMAGMAAGIVGFLGGIMLGNTLFEGANWMGADLDFGALGKALGGFSAAVGQLSPEAATALAGIIAGSAGLAVFGADAKTALGTAAIMTGIGAGIAGLMIGLTAGDAGISWLDKIAGANGSGLVGAFKMFNDSVGALDGTALTAFATILGAGTALGAFLGAATTPAGAAMAAVGIFAIMTGIGAGISGLMVGLAAGGKIADLIAMLPGDGGGLVPVFKMFNDSILALSSDAIKKLGELSNMGFTGLAGTMTGLAAGITALFGAGGLMQLTDTLKKGALEAFDWLFGTDTATKTKTPIETMLESLEPLVNVDPAMFDKMDEFGGAIDRFATSFSGLQDLDTKKTSTNLTKMIADMGGVLQLMDPLINGGEFDPNAGSFKGFMQGVFGNDREVIKFGKGLKGLDVANLDALAQGVNALRSALGGEAAPVTSPVIGLDAFGGAGDPVSTGSSVTIDEVTSQVAREVSIVKMSDEVLKALTATLMQQDYGERVAQTAGGNTTVINEGNTTNNSTSQGIITPPAGTNDSLDAGFATRPRRGHHP